MPPGPHRGGLGRLNRAFDERLGVVEDATKATMRSALPDQPRAFHLPGEIDDALPPDGVALRHEDSHLNPPRREPGPGRWDAPPPRTPRRARCRVRRPDRWCTAFRGAC